MAVSPELARALDDLARDLDLVVFRLEVDPPSDPERAAQERRRLRRDLERLRERVEKLAR